MNLTAVDERSLTLDDFYHLQALLNYEQEEREKHIEQCRNCNNEQKEVATITTKHQIHPLSVHRRHRPIQFRRAIDPQAAIQSKLEKARLTDALIKLKCIKDQYKRQRMLEIELYLEHYRRQALVSTVLQEEEERYYRQCIAAALEQRRVQLCLQQYMDIKQQEELQLLSDNKQQPKMKQDDEEEYSEYHSKQLAELLKHIFNQQQQQEDVTCKKQAESEQEQALAMAQVWKCLADQKLNDETPHSAFLSLDHDALLDTSSNTVISPPASSTNERGQSSVKVKDKLPSLEDHVVSLQDLIHQLASEPVLVDETQIQYSDEPKPSGIWANQQQPQPQPQHQQQKKTPFLPQHIFTEAEPTPTLENMPNTPLGTQEQEEDFKHFVDSVAAEQKNEIVPLDPKKLKTYQELNVISNQLLNPESDLVKRWQQVIQDGKNQQQLKFSKQQQGTLLLTASTDFNREVLGSEDELMRIMLKLDAIDSLGDQDIRDKRRKLIKQCESMLDNLDGFKQSQWEKSVVLNQ